MCPAFIEFGHHLFTCELAPDHDGPHRRSGLHPVTMSSYTIAWSSDEEEA